MYIREGGKRSEKTIVCKNEVHEQVHGENFFLWPSHCGSSKEG